jgi:tRNA threonylcarbamoyladenosine biosynthesis protein TsaE
LPTELLYDLVTHSPEETIAFGRDLAAVLHPPCLVLLEGDLGSGKTTLAKGIVAGLGAACEDEVTSPSFTLVHEYGPAETHAGQGIKVYHVDLYRVEGQHEIESLGLDDLLGSTSTVIIEWGEKLPDTSSLPMFRVRLEARTHADSDRSIAVEKIRPEC